MKKTKKGRINPKLKKIQYKDTFKMLICTLKTFNQD